MQSTPADLVLAALLAERLVEVAKHVLQPLLGEVPEPRRHLLWKLLGLAAGIVLAFGMEIDFFAVLGCAGAPWLGRLLAGILAGMGTQWVHEVLSNLPHEAVRILRAWARSRARPELARRGLRGRTAS